MSLDCSDAKPLRCLDTQAHTAIPGTFHCRLLIGMGMDIQISEQTLVFDYLGYTCFIFFKWAYFNNDKALSKMKYKNLCDIAT
jgi:hypothetical protein